MRQGHTIQGDDPSTGAGHPHAAEHGFDLSHLLSILLDRYKLILAMGAAGLLLGIVAALMSTPLYRASALIQYEPGAADLLEPGRYVAGQRSPKGNTQEGILTQIGLLQSESLARQVAQDLNLVSNPAYGGAGGTIDQRTNNAAAAVQGSITAEPIKGSALIRISAVSTDPRTAAQIANAVVKGHISASLARRFESSSYARDFLSDQIARTKESLEVSERNLNNYAIKAGVFRNTTRSAEGREVEGASLSQSKLSSLNEALARAKVNRIAAEQRYKEAELDGSLDQALSLSPLIQQKTELQAQYDEKLKIYKPDYPSMIELKARIDRIDAAINAERKRGRTNKRAELYGEYRAAVQTEAELQVAVNEAKGEVLADRNIAIEYNILQRETDTNRSLYDALLQRYKEVGVAGGIGKSEISMVDEAKVPAGPFRPRPLVNAIVGLLAGLALGVGLALGLQILFDSITDTRDVRTKLRLPVLGAIPVETDGRAPVEALADSKSQMSEAYHSVRTALKFARPEGLPHSLLVTSTRPGEGKSTSSYAIALSVAKLGSKVLLIDADLRKPTFASGRKDGMGLGHLLVSDDPLGDYIEATKTPNLSLLPVGRISASAAELLSSNRLPLLVKEAQGVFDMVVIDGPPVLGLADAPLLASVVDATALVVECRGARTAEVQEMVRRLADAGARLVGVILTKVTVKRSGYGYGYGYGYGHYSHSDDNDSDDTISARRIDVAKS